MADFDGNAIDGRPQPNRSVGESETRMFLDGTTINRMNIGRLEEEQHRAAARALIVDPGQLGDREYVALRHIHATRGNFKIGDMYPMMLEKTPIGDVPLGDVPLVSNIDEDKIRQMLAPRQIFNGTHPALQDANMSYSGDNKFFKLTNADFDGNSMNATEPEWYPKASDVGSIQSNGPGGDTRGYRQANGHMGKAFMTDPWKTPENRYKKYLEQLEGHHVFVLANDWAEILGEVIDTVKDDEVRLPYPVTVFDFAFTSVKTMVIATQDEGGPISVRIAYHPGRGVSKDYEHYAVCTCVCGQVQGPMEIEGTPCPNCGYRASSDPAAQARAIVEPLEFYVRHVKAACVALDVELATTPTAFEVHQIQDLHKDIKLRARLDKTHVLCLKPRKQGARLTKNTGKTVRLHFRRGHWRHYQNGKIKWIRWCIAGRAEVGAVIKSYKM